MYLRKIVPVLGLLIASVAQADSITVELYKTAPVQARGASVGSIHFTDTQYGLLIAPKLHDLPRGTHGFHLHKNPSCANQGDAAGPHFDPLIKNQHLGPYKEGHLGDLPALYIKRKGTDTHSVLAPRLKVSDLKGHSLIIHAGGDNYSDQPLPLGGGGARIACGVVK